MEKSFLATTKPFVRPCSHHGRNGFNHTITSIFSWPKVSNIHCVISQEPFLYSVRTLSSCRSSLSPVRVPKRTEIVSGRSQNALKTVENKFCDVPQAIFMFGNSLVIQTGDQWEITEWSVKHGNVAPITWLDAMRTWFWPNVVSTVLQDRTQSLRPASLTQLIDCMNFQMLSDSVFHHHNLFTASVMSGVRPSLSISIRTGYTRNLPEPLVQTLHGIRMTG